jgi:hypothetical protein
MQVLLECDGACRAHVGSGKNVVSVVHLQRIRLAIDPFAHPAHLIDDDHGRANASDAAGVIDPYDEVRCRAQHLLLNDAREVGLFI